MGQRRNIKKVKFEKHVSKSSKENKLWCKLLICGFDPLTEYMM